jgi:hypothetical protein
MLASYHPFHLKSLTASSACCTRKSITNRDALIDLQCCSWWYEVPVTFVGEDTFAQCTARARCFLLSA